MARRSDLHRLVDRNEQASPEARERAKVILLTLAGTMSVEQACRWLHIGRTRFQDVRRRMLAAAVAALEEKPAGRPRSQLEKTRRGLPAWRRRLESLEHELRIAQAELDIARSGAGPAAARRVAARSARKGGRR